MFAGGHRIESGRRWFIVLAALALLMQLLVPQGFMVHAAAAAPGLVICTGHGAFVVADRQHPAKAPKPGGDSPCAFAAHGATAPPPLPVAVATVDSAAAPATVLPRLRDLTPGRGLAAPPPPSHGPPAHLI